MRKVKAFTLVELVVVVMILGILAAVAAPKLLNTSKDATDNGLRQTLAIVRDAIERYAAENGGVPPSDPTTDLTDFIRGPFPTCPVGNKNANVKISSSGAALTVDGAATEAWLYDSVSGEFIVNSGATLASDVSVTYDQL